MSTLGTCSLWGLTLQIVIFSSIVVHECSDINNINIMTSAWLLRHSITRYRHFSLLFWTHMPPNASKDANGNTWSINGFKTLTVFFFYCAIKRVKMYPLPAQNKLAQVKPFASTCGSATPEWKRIRSESRVMWLQQPLSPCGASTADRGCTHCTVFSPSLQ